jgi:hypothetical protein
MRISPRRWLGAAWLLGLVTFASGPAIAQTASFEGILAVVWGDPRPGSAGGATLFNLTVPDGTTYPLDIDTAQQNAAIGQFGRRVVVRGRMTRGSGGASRIAVDQLDAAEQERAGQPRAAVTRRVLYVLLKYQGDTQEPHPPQFFLDLTNPKVPPAGSNVVATLNGFYYKESWNNLKYKADVAGVGGLNPTNWLTLPQPKSSYANCDFTGVCADLNKIKDDGMVLAVAAGVDVSVYDNINLVLNNDLDCCAWGGGFVYNGKFYGATWEPPWGQEAGVYIHEFGHSLGLPHSGWVYYAYDSPWDEMSNGSHAQSVQCATYSSANNANVNTPVFCTEPGAGYITAHKDHLGWLPAANKVVINGPTNQVVTVEANGSPLGTGIKMIKVCLSGKPCSGPQAHFLTVEARVRGKPYSNGVPGDGVIIHDVRMARGPIGEGDPCFFNSSSGWAVPIDATPGDYDSVNCNSGGLAWPNYALGNAQFVPGDVYKSKRLHVTIRILRKKKSTYVVRVIRSQ